MFVSQYQLLLQSITYFFRKSMQIIAPLFTIGLQYCLSFAKTTTTLPQKSPHKSQRLRYYQNKKFITQHQIVKVKAMIQSGESGSVIFGKKAPQVQRQQGKRLLLLDLDQTLIHAKGVNGIQLRPYTQQFLEAVHQDFEIIIFTAASKEYTTSIFRKFQRQFRKISGFLHRDHCTSVVLPNVRQKIYVKQLSIIESYGIEQILVVDDTAVTYCMNKENSIGISPFFGEQQDKELQKLGEILKKSKSYTDLRELGKQVTDKLEGNIN